MATVKPYIQHVKNDKTSRVSIELTHKGRRAYLETNIYVTQSDFSPDLKLKKSYHNKTLNAQLSRLRDYIADLGYGIKSYTVQELKEYLLRQEQTQAGAYINFISFCENENRELEKRKGRNGTYGANTTALEWLKKFAKSDSLNINDINKRYLERFEAFMRQEGLGEAGISSYLRALRTLFIAAMDEYNDEARGVYLVKHYPFRSFKIKEYKPEKRNAGVDALRLLIDASTVTTREALGRDMFLLTFYLAGIAPIDLYNLKEPANGHIDYYRDKVKHRTNRVRVRIKIGEEAKIIIEKYSSKSFLSDIKRYASEKEFSKACKLGLESLINRLNAANEERIKNNEIIEIPQMTLYWARHTFSSIAGSLGFDTNLIDYTLGHAPSVAKMAEVYIERTQESVDKLVAAVINEVHSPI